MGFGFEILKSKSPIQGQKQNILFTAHSVHKLHGKVDKISTIKRSVQEIREQKDQRRISTAYELE